MSERPCCACKREPSVAVASFPLLSEGYPLGATCNAAWRKEAQSLGGAIYNPAKVRLAFKRWLEVRTKSAATTKPEPRPEGWWRALLAEGLRLARGER